MSDWGNWSLIWISLPYATFGIGVEDGIVVDAPPIAHWMIGKSTAEVRRWLDGKNAATKLLDTGPVI